ncbi:hypothetical protein CU044_1310 [Streptomyces sp. L-9-10]|nr:hypothetical protein CU044_1310 [Streptomyces sp. L-9-10]
MRDPEPARLAALLPQACRDLQHGVLRARNHHGRGAVDGGDRHLVLTLEQQRKDLVLRRPDRDHRTTGRQRPHQPRPGDHQRAGVLQREHPRHMRRRDLTDRMPRHEVRDHTPRLHQPEQRHLHREQRRLSERGVIQQISVLAPHHLTQRPPQLGIQHREYGIQRLREHREPPVQLAAHPQPLTALTGEEEGTLTGCHHARHSGRVRFAGRQCRQRALRVGGVAGQYDRAVLEHRTARHQREADVHRTRSRARPDEGQQPPRLIRQRLWGPAREHPRHHARLHTRDLGRGAGPGEDRSPDDGGRLFQDDVGVRPADTERRDSRPPRAAGLRPLHRLRQQLHGTRRPVDMRRRLGHMERPRQHPVPHRHHHLDHSGDTGRGLRVTDVRLHRAQQQRTLGVAIAPVRREECLRLDRVAERRPRTVRLHHIDVVGRESATGQRLTDHALLRRTVRRRQPVRRTVLVDRAAAQQGEHLVAVAPRVGQPLQHQHADALRPGDAVGRLGERLGPAVGGQTACPGELDEGARGGHDGDTAGQCQRAFTAPQGLRGQMHADQGGGARGVHGHRRAFEPQRVRDTAGGHTRRAAVAAEGFVLLAREQRPVVVVHDTGEDAGPAVAQRDGVDTGALDGLPGEFEQQALLGVGGHRLAR